MARPERLRERRWSELRFRERKGTGIREIAIQALLVVTLVLPAATGRAAAQEPAENAAEFVPRFSVGAYGGSTTFGTFLEQRVADREREVTAEAVLSGGISVGYDPWRNTGLRAAVSWSPGELRFEDDTGDGGTTLDRPAVGEFHAVAFTVELVRFLMDERNMVAPYAMGGISWTVWSFDEATLADAVVAPGEKSTLTRFGETASVGVQIRPARDFVVRLELTTALLGNPFEGSESLRVVSDGETFSEPSRTSRRTLGIGLVYSVGFAGGEEDDDGR